MDASLLDLFWEGFELESYEIPPPNSLLLRLAPKSSQPPFCSDCGQATLLIHDVSRRHVRERDLFNYWVWLEVPVRRVRCADCGVRREKIRWLAGRRNLPQALVNYVEALVRLLPVKQVAELLGLHWHTVKSIDHQRLTCEVTAPDLGRVQRLIMDEFALFKGHRYATVAICADTQQVLLIGEGRSRKAVRPFFEWMGKKVCRRIEAVAMDMNTAMDLEVQKHCPKARVVYDLFHVVAKFGREVIDRVRVDQANLLRDSPAERRVIKRSRWLLLRNPGNLSQEQGVKLEELLAATAPLTTVYVLKTQLKELWYAPSENEARRRWGEWFAMALDSGIKPLMLFAKRLQSYLSGIVASAVFRLNTSVLEGMNNRIKVLKRMAYGYRDNDYFFLKIKAAFSGKTR
ncbi:ISL3 family transposase [Marinobacterium rhizophilum]|uniref:ISL3 family transposase n=1 Tax=Marinobacterium rhizophilum TaxID=420402 RepID=UPI00035E9ECD|nr:ISL3 family transposase [Marinobacterium rhizophilum]